MEIKSLKEKLSENVLPVIKKWLSLVVKWVVRVLIAIFVMGVIWFFIQPLTKGLTFANEVHFYIRIFIALVMLQTFAILRLYNAIVSNTRFSIKLREAVVKLHQEFSGLERVLKSLGVIVTTNSASVTGLSKSVKESSTGITSSADLLIRQLNEIRPPKK